MDTPLIADDISSEQNVWNTQDTLTYYQTHRRTPVDLYPSERFYLPDVLPRVQSALDVGCAAGGFCRIMRSYNAGLRYVGMDIIPELIEVARKDHPEGDFVVGDGLHFPFSSASFDLVHSSGVLHLNSRYPDMIKAMWDQTRHYLLFDIRLTEGTAFKGTMRQPPLPYYVLNIDAFLAFLQSLNPQPSVLRAKGYPHEAAATARLPQKNIIMACFLLEKRAEHSRIMEIDFNAA